MSIRLLLIQLLFTQQRFARWLGSMGLSLFIAACAPNIVGGELAATNKTDASSTGQNDGAVDETNDGGPVERAYPLPPYGVVEGAVVQNMVFSGYWGETPTDNLAQPANFRENISLADFRRNTGYRYLLLNVAAEWCASCQVEARTLPHEYTEWAPRGGNLLVVLTEDARKRPATKSTLDAWAAAFKPNYPIVFDPNAEINNLFTPQTLPLNAIIDLDSMRIELMRIGTDEDFFKNYTARLSQ